ncbi:MAG: DUF1003 domain-containing protein [Bacteroidales bacterium]
MNTIQKVTCFITHAIIYKHQAIKGEDMREAILAFIKEQYPDFSVNDYISRAAMDKIRREYLVRLMTLEDADITQTEQEVIDAITTNKILTEDIEPIIDQKLTLGQRYADKIAEFGGSWIFIISFGSFLLFWILLNVWILGSKRFDPFPFILLNLILSCLAAIQAPIIMMSQNRLEQKDRLRSENDYKVNLKAELEIKLLHEKMDHLSLHQNKILFEVQQMQIEYLNDILDEIKKKN